MMDLFSDFFDIFDSMDIFKEQGIQPRENKKCPTCGHTWEDFNRTGKFGCGDCYKTFSDSVSRVLRQIHSSDKHEGKLPSKSGAEIKAKRHLEELKRQLKTAVANEEYEKAARLHSEIKSIEGGTAK